MSTLPNLRVVVVVVIILFLILYPSSQSPGFAEKQTKTSIAKQRHQLRVLNNSTWDSFSPEGPEGGSWLDLIGLRRHDNCSWPLLSVARDAATAQLQYATGDEGLQIAQGMSNATLLQYQNITGWVRGRWVRKELPNHFNLSLPDPSAIVPDVDYANLNYQCNITGQEGKIQIKLDQSEITITEQKNETIEGISAGLTIQDETSSGDGWDIVLHGYHIPRLGSSVLTTSSEKFGGIYALPHFSMTRHLYQLSKPHMNETLAEAIEKREDELKSLYKSSWSSQSGTEDPSNPRCEFIVYLQQYPVEYSLPRTAFGSTSNDLSGLELLEDELRFPSGGLYATSPKLQMSMTIFSPDCGFILESKGPPNQTAQSGFHLRGYKIEIYIAQGKQVVSVLIILLLLQLVLLVRQMRDSATPAARSRLSFHTISILSLGSAFIWVAFMVVATVDDSMYLTMMAVAFFAFLAGSFFGMKFLLDIWNAQEPEQNEWQQRQERNNTAAERATPPAPNNTAPPDTEDSEHAHASSGSEGSLPPPATAPRPPASASIPFMESFNSPTPDGNTAQPSRPTRGSFGAQYTRFYLILVTLFFVSIHASSSWPPIVRSIYANSLAFCYLSFWVPQIYRNVIRNCRKALSWPFVIGQSILSMIPFAYFWGFDDNILFVETNRRILGVFAGWLWLQIVVLASQDIIGPRFLVSEKWKWVPPAWDYHPILREDEEGAAMPVGMSNYTPVDEEPGPSSMLTPKLPAASERGKKVFDCAICMFSIEVPVVPPGRYHANEGLTSSLGGGFLARRSYMVTPCRHIFHTSCLEAWIGYRLQCPNCRESLPPL